MSNAQDLTSETLPAAIASGVALVDFWATWCPPCKMLSPIVDAVAAGFDGNDGVTIAKVDADAEASLVSQYSVSALPTILIFKDGQIVERFVGLRDQQSLVDAVNKALGESD